ncbi:uncharacterized protein [Sinocyclocheilus grahami]|uniref:uncharacterized protein n=1 Tax=Sinocyclocheilus grahami TaxID=75366 RepID=UPI0007ACAB80|nr:PREDICTED: uncharacterized protein LOC107550371 [Sinocyclocheilus grahami]
MDNQMLSRNLEILSGMKWNIRGLLLILSALFCISVGDSTGNIPPKCPLHSKSADTKNGNKEMDMFILGSCGFKGYMKTGSCNGDTWGISQNQSVSLLQCGFKVSSENLFKISVFPIVEDAFCTGNTTHSTNTSCTTYSSDCGVTLSRHPPYKLNISRSVMPTFVCLIEGKCRNYTLTNWITKGCNWSHQTPKYFENAGYACNMTCLNPSQTCKNAQYDSSCKGKEGNINRIVVHNKTATCYKCGSPLQDTPKIQASSNDFNTNKTEIDAAAAA